MVVGESLLIVGAKPKSLGDYIRYHAKNQNYKVTTVGLDEEDYKIDLTGPNVNNFLGSYGPFKNVICTAGVNHPDSILDGGLLELSNSMKHNVFGPLTLLAVWLRMMDRPRFGNFVAISSNSAHIPRTGSLSYCATKAALSMGLRVAAREVAKDQRNVSVWGYESGWLDGTPMSENWALANPGAIPHRIPGGQGIRVEQLAERIVTDLNYGAILNGAMIRIDGGEI